MEIFYREKAFHTREKIRKNDFVPSEKYACYAPGKINENDKLHVKLTSKQIPKTSKIKFRKSSTKLCPILEMLLETKSNASLLCQIKNKEVPVSSVSTEIICMSLYTV